MRKLFALILTVLMVLSVLTACSEEEEKKKITLENTVIYDKNDLKITVTDMRTTTMGVYFDVSVENHSEKSVLFTASHFVVNGITVKGQCYIEAKAGKDTEDTFYLYNSGLESAQIDTVATVRGVNSAISNMDTLETMDTFIFNLVTSAGEDYVQEISRKGDVLLDSSDLTVLAQPFDHPTYGGATRLLFFNDTGKSIIVEAKDIKVNDKQVDGQLHEMIYMDSVCYSDLNLYSSSLSSSGISSVSSISFSLYVYDALLGTLMMDPKPIVISVG